MLKGATKQRRKENIANPKSKSKEQTGWLSTQKHKSKRINYTFFFSLITSFK